MYRQVPAGDQEEDACGVLRVLRVDVDMSVASTKVTFDA